VRDASPRCGRTRRTTPAPTGVTLTRRGFFCRVRIEDYGPGRVRPHERTHPGPKEDRLRLTRATRANISPIFSLYSDPRTRPGRRSRRPPSSRRGARSPTPTAPSIACGASATPQAIAAVQAAAGDAELLIADGHHRYETMQAYAEEIGGEGEHRYILMCLVALEDPGLTVFPTHRLVEGWTTSAGRRSRARCARDFEISRCRSRRSRPPAGEAGRCSSSATSTPRRAAHCA
jgi:uncharacterized protein (DUF1015 family)